MAKISEVSVSHTPGEEPEGWTVEPEPVILLADDAEAQESGEDDALLDEPSVLGRPPLPQTTDSDIAGSGSSDVYADSALATNSELESAQPGRPGPTGSTNVKYIEAE